MTDKIKKPLSYSGVKSILISTGDYWVKHILRKKKTTPAMIEGKVFHACITGDWSGIKFLPKGYKANLKKFKDLSLEIKKSEDDYVSREILLKWIKITKRLRRSDILKDCDFEIKLQENLFQYPFVGYADAIDHKNGIIYDFKSFSLGTGKNIDNAIMKSFYNFNYHLQGFIYTNLAKKIFNKDYRMVFLFCRTDDFLNTYHPKEIDYKENMGITRRCADEVKKAINIIIECQKKGKWIKDEELQHITDNCFSPIYLDEKF